MQFVDQSDYLAVTNHLARYCFLVDAGSAEEIADLFWDDGRLQFNGEHLGKDKIRQCFRSWITEMRDPVQGLRHLLHVPHIRFERDIAFSEAYADSDAHTRRKGRPIQNRAIYKDQLAKRGGEWKFLERRIIWMTSITETI